MKDIDLLSDDSGLNIPPVTERLEHKLTAIIKNGASSVQLLKAFCEFTLTDDKWEEQLTPLLPQLKEFMDNRNGDINNYHDLVQYGHLFIITIDGIFRNDYIKENVHLTDAERQAMSETVDEAFKDKVLREVILKYAATVGWQLSKQLDQFVDKKEVEEKLASKIEALKVNFAGLMIASQILERLEVFQQAHLIAERVRETTDLVVTVNNEVLPITEKGKATLETYGERDDVLQDEPDFEKLAKDLSDPLTVLLKKSDKLITL